MLNTPGKDGEDDEPDTKDGKGLALLSFQWVFRGVETRRCMQMCCIWFQLKILQILHECVKTQNRPNWRADFVYVDESP